MMHTNKEIYALSRVLDLLEEGSFSYLARHDRRFDRTLADLYRNVSREISKLEHTSGSMRFSG